MAGLDIQQALEDAAQAAVRAKQDNALESAAQQALQAREQTVADNEPGFFGRIGARLQERGDRFNEQAPPENVVESMGRGVQVLGMGAGGMLDVAGETLSTGFDLLSKVTSAVTPDFIEDPIVKGVGDAFETIVGTDVAQKGMEAAAAGMEAYQGFATEHPEASRTIEALANIAMVAAPVKGIPKPVAGGPTAVGRAGQRVAGAADAQTQATRASFIDDLVRPRTSKAVREQEILRTSEGGLATGRSVTPSAGEQAIASVVTDVAGVTPKNTMLQNLGAIQAEIGVEAKSLASILESSTVKIGRPDIKSSMDDVLTRLADNPILVGDAARTGERTVSKAREFMSSNPNTPAGVFKARQEFDAWVSSQRPKIFDPNTESALSIAVRETRQAMNDIVAANAGASAGVRESLSRQSSMFRAIESIGPKAADEAGSAIGRLGQSVSAALGLKNSITQVASAAAVTGGVALDPALATGAAAVLGLAMVGNRVVMSPATKRSVAKLLTQTERAIQAAKGNPDLLRQLRADRAVVVELMKSNQSEE